MFLALPRPIPKGSWGGGQPNRRLKLQSDKDKEDVHSLESSSNLLNNC